MELDWDKPEERHKGLQVLVTQAEALRRWVDEHAAESKTEPKVEEALDVLAQVIKQDGNWISSIKTIKGTQQT